MASLNIFLLFDLFFCLIELAGQALDQFWMFRSDDVRLCSACVLVNG